MRQLTSSTLFTPEMAVVLERESESTGNTPTKLPKVIVKNAPIQPPSNLKGVITSRTSRTFTSEEQIRKAVWKENYDRYMADTILSPHSRHVCAIGGGVS